MTIWLTEKEEEEEEEEDEEDELEAHSSLIIGMGSSDPVTREENTVLDMIWKCASQEEAQKEIDHLSSLPSSLRRVRRAIYSVPSYLTYLPMK